MTVQSIPQLFFQQAKRRPHHSAYFVRADGRWVPTTWADYVAETRRAARALIKLDVKPGQVVAILGFNRPEWVMFSQAAMAVGAAGAGIYTTNSPREVGYILGHAEAPLVLLEDAEQLEKVKKIRKDVPRLTHVVLMKGAEDAADGDFVLSWEQFLALADEVEERALDERLDNLDPGALAQLIYTSGTTGPPKGVMLTHQNLAWTAQTAMDVLGIGEFDSALSYLPLSHIAEQMFTMHGPAASGMSIYFAESMEALPDNLKEVQPTLFFGVPRVWEKFHAKVAEKLGQAEGAKKKLLDWARTTARDVHDYRNRGEEPPLGLRLQYKGAKKLIFDKLHPALGLARAQLCVSGAAPIAQEVLEFFYSLDIPIREVYGQSEDCGPTTLNVPGRTRMGTVGPPFPGVEVKIADDGEILVRGPNVFAGYYKDPEATAAALSDGWLHSGDVGEFDADGFLEITGRKKDIIITAGGKNITPSEIESALKQIEGISDAVVIGDRRKFLSALLTFDPEAEDEVRKKLGITGDLVDSPEFRQHVQAAVDALNQEKARVSQIQKFTILPRPFSIENGELTPTMKVKRRVVNDNYEAEIEAMYR